MATAMAGPSLSKVSVSKDKREEVKHEIPMNGHDRHSHQDRQSFLKVKISMTRFL